MTGGGSSEHGRLHLPEMLMPQFRVTSDTLLEISANSESRKI